MKCTECGCETNHLHHDYKKARCDECYDIFLDRRVDRPKFKPLMEGKP